MDIEIVDNFLPEFEAEKVLDECRSANYLYGESDSQLDCEKKLPPTGMTSHLDYDDYISKVLNEKIQIKFPSLYCGKVNARYYINCYSPGEVSYFHTDCDSTSEWYDSGYTLLYYPNKNLDINEGGETQFYVDGKIIGIPSVYNRLVKFRVPILHRATPFKSHHRFSIALKFISRFQKDGVAI
jgi:Rps23 Pro-64 3,4-dihydroxylase Tpa1-like proline 4-hydroxylase